MNVRKKLLLRIDPKLHEELAAWAQQEFRSVNAQIEFLLREAVARRRGRMRLTGDDSGPEPSGNDGNG